MCCPAPRKYYDRTAVVAVAAVAIAAGAGRRRRVKAVPDGVAAVRRGRRVRVHMQSGPVHPRTVLLRRRQVLRQRVQPLVPVVSLSATDRIIARLFIFTRETICIRSEMSHDYRKQLLRCTCNTLYGRSVRYNADRYSLGRIVENAYCNR